jgi:hypothetical protein
MLKIIISCLFFSYLSYGDDKQPPTIGTIAAVTGEAWILPHGDLKQQRRISANDKLKEHDLIITSESAMLKILLVDDTIIDLGNSSKFIFHHFQIISAKQRKAEFELAIGSLRAIYTVKNELKEAMKIKTPKLTISIEGTELLVESFKDKDHYESNIALLSGNISVEMEQKKIALKPNQMLITNENNHIVELDQKQLRRLSRQSLLDKNQFLNYYFTGTGQAVNQELASMYEKLKPNSEIKKEKKEKVDINIEALSPTQRKALKNQLGSNMLKEIERMKSLSTGPKLNSPANQGTGQGITAPSIPTTGPNLSTPAPGSSL